MPKRTILIAVAFALALVFPARTAPQYARTITVTAGTAIRIVSNSTIVNSVAFEMLHGGTGLGYVLNANPSVTCTKGAAGTSFVGELAPATSTAPGSTTWSLDRSTVGGFDLAYFCVDGAVSGDTILVTWDFRN